MPKPVFVVSEWLPKKGHEKEVFTLFKKLLSLTKEKEPGCIRAHVTRQIPHPGSPGTSKFTIVLLQEYKDLSSFDLHCSADYVQNFFKTYIDNENPEANLIEEWRCRLFSEEE